MHWEASCTNCEAARRVHSWWSLCLPLLLTLCARAIEAGAEECIRRGAGASSSCRFSLSESGEWATPRSLARSVPFSSASRSSVASRSASINWNTDCYPLSVINVAGTPIRYHNHLHQVSYATRSLTAFHRDVHWMWEMYVNFFYWHREQTSVANWC